MQIPHQDEISYTCQLNSILLWHAAGNSSLKNDLVTCESHVALCITEVA
jgi:hypothetical protein